MRLRFLPLLFGMIVLASGANAQSRVGTGSPIDFELIVGRTLAPGQRIARFLEETRRILFDPYDLDRDGAITAADRDYSLKAYTTLQRPAVVSQILRADFDGDGIVTKAELMLYLGYLGRISIRGDGAEVAARRQKYIDAQVTALMRADRNSDERIDWAEMVAYGKQTIGSSPPISFDQLYRSLLALDANGDGKTEAAEFVAALEKRFADVDTDDDGIITKNEFEAFWRRAGKAAPRVEALPATREEKMSDACALPRPTKAAKLVLFTAYDLEGLSTVAIGSQDLITKASRVTIEPGDQPLYIVLLSPHRALWKFEGAVERVQQVVLVAMAGSGTDPTPVGAAGLPKDVVTFGGSGNCGTLLGGLVSGDPDSVRRSSRLLLNREPDVVREADAVWNLRMPSTQVSVPTEAERDRTFPIDNPTAIHLNFVRSEFLRYNPGGLLAVDPASVIAAVPVSRYEVLPEYAGLLQLMLEGVLDRDRRGEFLILKPMRFPADTPNVKFRLLKGVPIPTGDSGQSTVWSEESGGRLCLSTLCKQRQK